MSKKSRTVALVLSFFFGGGGFHHFYLGNKMKGVVSLLFCWTLIPAVLGVVDCVRMVLMSAEEFDHKYNGGPKPDALNPSFNTEQAVKRGIFKAIIKTLLRS